jgi:D-amino-acid oxidase
LKIIVLGAGIIGLTCARVLLERGHHVSVIYRDPPLNSTSSVATAIWHVYLVDPNDTRNLDWSAKTLSQLLTIAEAEPEAGVYLVQGVEIFRRSEASTPSWAGIPPLFEMLAASDLHTFPGATWGYRIAAPLAEMPFYISWLVKSVLRLGGRFVCRRVGGLAELGDEGADAIVNATGLGARSIVGDLDLIGVRGQYLCLDRPPGIPDEYVGDDENPLGMAYVIPRRHDVMIGGTEEYGMEAVEFEESPDALISRCSELAPWLGRPELVAIKQKVVGIRPWRRSGVRVELDRKAVDGSMVVHCYGHGGSGFSLSWGCAESVAEIIETNA